MSYVLSKWVINTLEWSGEITLFTLIKHKINNTGWMMKWWWREGVELSANPSIERLLNVFNLHFSAPEEKAVSRNLRLQNQEKFANIWLVLKIQTVMPVGFTILLLYAENKQRNQWNGASSFKEKCPRKAQHYQSSLKEEKPLQFEFTNIAAKKNQDLFCEIGVKRGREKEGESVTTGP